MRKKLLIALMTISFGVNAQHQGDVWVFPNGNLLDFAFSPPQASGGSQILPNDGEVEGVASMSDEDGNLLFYSDGVKLWDWQNNVISTSLMGHQSSTNAAYIVPVPSSANRYYLFTLDAMQNNLANGLRYSIVEACRENGVVLVSENQFLSSNMTEKMAAIRHQNGVDYWLVSHEFGTDVFKTFLIEEQGVSLEGSFACGSIHGPEMSAAVGQMKASPNGDLLVANISNKQRTDIISFNKTNGSVTCLLSFPPDTSASGSFRSIYGASFSSDSRFVYISGGSRFRLWQFDLNALLLSNEAFYASKYTLSDDDFQSNSSFHQLQLGSDNKIYCASWENEHVAVIHEPNLPGIACTFEDSALVLSNLGNYGLPAFIDSYDYTTSGVCEPDGVEAIGGEQLIVVFPNPTTGEVRFKLHSSVSATAVVVYDMLGKKVMGLAYQPTIDVSALPKGNYIVAVQTKEHTYRQLLVVE